MKQYRPRMDEYQYKLYSDLHGKVNIGIIGDTHLPFEKENYAEFCYETFNMFQCDIIVHIGDLIDFYIISNYEPHNPNAHSPAEEAERAQIKLEKDWYPKFPDVKLCIGNHDERIIKACAKGKIPDKFVKSFKEVWQMPEGWDVQSNYTINNCYFTHGTGSSGKNAAINRAIEMRRNVTIGHTHTYAGCKYHANSEDYIFGLNVGCGIDINSYAMAYAKDMVRKPNIGCGVILGGRVGIFIPMEEK